MKQENRAKIVFESRGVNEGFARTVVAGFAASLDPTVEELADLKTAVSEAVTNCIVHAYRDRVGLITMTLSSGSDGTFRIVVADKGCGIDNVEQAMTPMFTTGDPAERSGLGFSVMQSFTDTLRVTSRPGKGTRVTMVKKLHARA